LTEFVRFSFNFQLGKCWLRFSFSLIRRPSKMQGKTLLLLIALASIHGSVSFLPTLPLAKVQSKKSTHHQQLLPSPKPQQAVTTLSRKGSLLALSPTSIIPVIASNLQSGPFGVLALSAVTWSVVLPLTLYKKFLGVGIAYGFSILAAGYSMLQVMSSPSPHAVLMAQACIFHGARLGCYMMRKYPQCFLFQNFCPFVSQSFYI
jgi:hypothetical protein